jgi:DNA invertase Pin-like site-specific DNA recombinase
MFQMLGVFAEFERAIIRERIMAGLSRAKQAGTKSGRPIGRPKTVTAEMEKAIRSARTEGNSLRNIAEQVGTSLRSVQRVLESKAA